MTREKLKILCKFFLVSLLFLSLFALNIFAQNEEIVEVTQKILKDESYGDCKIFEPGKVVLFLPTVFPEEAKKESVGGTVLVAIKLDERGVISEIVNISGNELLQETAKNTALKTRFTPTSCNEIPIKAAALITYDFIPNIPRQKFLKPEKIGVFTDTDESSQYYESILNLTENYKLAFGFDGGKFYENVPLTRGDFAQFLRLTLDMLSENIKNSNGSLKQIKVFSAYNLRKINSASKIKGLENDKFYSDSVKILLQTYNIAIVDNENRFQANQPLKLNELLNLWTEIFGEDAVPIHFHKSIQSDKMITRGEFALFLNESLRVLTYKVLP